MSDMFRVAALALLSVCAPALAGQGDEETIPRVLLDSDLRASTVRLVSIGPDSVSVRDQNGKPVTYERRQVAAILPVIEGTASLGESTERADAPPEHSAPLGRLELVMGEQLPGMLSSKPGQGDRLAWESHLWGRVELPLERAAFVLLQPESAYATRRPTGSADVAVLANGDTIEGFVSSLGPSLRIERDHKVTQLPPERVVSVIFANPPEKPKGAWVWLHDGSAVGVTGLELSSGGELKLAGLGAAALRAGELRAIVFDAGRLTPLSGLPMQLGPSDPARRWTRPPIVGDARQSPAFAADIELPGPMSVRFTLPKGATRVGGRAELPANCRVWGDCELLVGVLGGKPTRIRLNSETPEVDFSVDIAGAGGDTLEISIDPGPSGPVQDRVVLRRPVVRIGRQ
ncbi:MAG: hypothetical protein GC200_00910 [Tepidisphaera sp.]|nr:hypothetical protein [Tepidisphaera sp.]